ncbi:3-demethylubiquinone-9 3-methyltransferase [Plakobranchus ocellatus]|uniref:3-demethylubiquinone-9 3-methyltransferase n=1 Tax=Plakobranchus ocellatus TaxID=259542 RepID=A0AAV4CCR8_9GAST|nr:3-demethylubiquinone-9 3-methyltransferase [Plakobranchus ocellatus]
MASFSERVSSTISNSLVGLAVSMSWEVGIFQALLDTEVPLTSHQVAQAKGLKERYVRELLGCMSVAEFVRIVEGEDGTFLYTLEEEAKKALQSRLAALLTFPAVLSSTYSSVKECVFQHGPAGHSYSDRVQAFFDNFLEYDAPLLTSAFLENVPNLQTKLEQGIDVIEYGAGQGQLSATLASKFPNSHFVASEVVSSLVDKSRTRWDHISNLSFSLDDACSLQERPGHEFDWVFCNNVIHDLPDPVAALQGIKRVLKKPEGVFTFLDHAFSGSPLKEKGNLDVARYYATGTFLCIPESYQREESLALGPCWGKQTSVGMLQNAGYLVEVVTLDKARALFICHHSKET